MPGVTVRVTDRCVGCGQCVQEGICFMEAIQIRDGRAVISDMCKGCGRCVNVCPHGAIELSIEDEGFIEQSIARISSVVDVS
jgi:MinD superfamily P-loop ATPase